MIVSESQGKLREPIPADVYDAVCVTLVGIGTQKTQFGSKQQLYLGWEIPDVIREFENEDGSVDKKRAIIHSRKLAVGLGGANKPTLLSKFLTGWRGKPFTEEEKRGFDVKNVVRKSCRLNITNDQAADGSGKIYDGVDSVLTAKNQIEPEAEIIYFDINEHDSLLSADNEMSGWPPSMKWIADKVRESEEYQALLSGQAGSAGGADSITDDDVLF